MISLHTVTNPHGHADSTQTHLIFEESTRDNSKAAYNEFNKFMQALGTSAGVKNDAASYFRPYFVDFSKSNIIAGYLIRDIPLYTLQKIVDAYLKVNHTQDREKYVAEVYSRLRYDSDFNAVVESSKKHSASLERKDKAQSSNDDVATLADKIPAVRSRR